mmetsp:Transcript_10979/g.10886  ORF Transcript_10979/g.10886 Transcript_10979/m.10886 type:complete len:97 (+) Transcript_10979:432-722(+)
MEVHQSSMAFDHKMKEFTHSDEGVQQQRPLSGFMAKLSPFHQGLMQTLGNLYCLKEYGVNCFQDSNEQSSYPNSSALAEIGDGIESYLSSSLSRHH